MSEADPHRERLHGTTLRPLKWGRVVLHVAGGLLALSLYLLYFTHTEIIWFSGIMLGSLATVDFVRWRFAPFNEFIFSQLGNFTQPHERQHVTSATWFWMAMFLVSLLQHPIAFIATLAILSVADQAASIIGRQFGNIPLISGRSLQGSLAFVLAGTATASLALMFSGLNIQPQGAIFIGFCGSLSGALAELGSERIDDNLSIGVVSGGTVMGISWLLQLG